MKWCELREYKWNAYVTIAVNRNLSNCEKARKKGFRGFNGIRTRGLCVSAAVLYQPELWIPMPYTGGRPIYWVHQPVKGMKHRMKWCELREYKWNEYVTIAVNRNGGRQWRPASSIWVFIAQAGRVLQRQRRGHGFESRWSPEILFFGLFRNCLNCDSLRWSHTHFINILCLRDKITYT